MKKIDKDRLRTLIGEGKTGQAIKELLVITAKVDESLRNQVINLQNQYNELRNEKIAGVLYRNESSVEYARIKRLLLKVIDLLPDEYPAKPKKKPIARLRLIALLGAIVVCLLVVGGGYYFLNDSDNDTSIIPNNNDSIKVESPYNNENMKNEALGLDTKQGSTSPVSQSEKQESIKSPTPENVTKTQYKKKESLTNQSNQNTIAISPSSTSNVSQIPVPNPAPNQNTFESTIATQSHPNNTSTNATTTILKSPVTEVSKVEDTRLTTEDAPLSSSESKPTLYSYKPFIINSTDVVIKGLKINGEVYKKYNMINDYGIEIIGGLKVGEYEVELLNRHDTPVAKCYIELEENAKGITMSSHNTCDTW